MGMEYVTLHCPDCGCSYEVSAQHRHGDLFCAACGGALGDAPPRETSDEEDAFIGRKIGPVKLKKRLAVRLHYALYRGWHARLRTDVRIKVFPEDNPRNTAAYVHDVFERAAAARSIRDLNVAGLLDMGRLRDGYFMVLEYAPRSADGLPARGKPLSAERCLPIVEGVLRGLAALDGAGAVHGDVRPQTILLAQDGTARLDNPSAVGHHRLNRLSPREDGAAGGPAFYVAPERAADERTADIRADLYSLGAVLYRMLTAEQPVDGETAAEVITGHLEGRLSERVAARSDLPVPLKDFLTRLTALDPADRPAGPEEALEELFQCVRRIEQAGGWSGALPGDAEAGPPRTFSHWTLVGLLLIAAAIVPFLFLFTGQEEEGPERPSEHKLLVVVKATGPPALEDLEERARAARRLVRHRMAFYPGLLVVAGRTMTEEAGDAQIEEARQEAEATHVLLLAAARGLRRTNWGLAFFDRTGEGWTESAECAIEDGTDDWTELEGAVRDVVGAAAGRMSLQPAPGAHRTAGADRSAWLALDRALEMEREDRLREAGSVLERAAESLPTAAWLRAYCATVLRLREDEPPPALPDVRTELLPPRMRSLARALEAIGTGQAERVQAEFGDWLARFPDSVRGYLLLGLWRLRLAGAEAEGLMTLRHAVKVDPEYLPAARACLDALSEHAPEALKEFLEEYPGSDEVKEALQERAGSATGQ